MRFFMITLCLLSLTLNACAMRHVTTSVPGCTLSRVEAPRGCELQRYPDRVETHCPISMIGDDGKVHQADKVLVYTCKKQDSPVPAIDETVKCKR